MAIENLGRWLLAHAVSDVESTEGILGDMEEELSRRSGWLASRTAYGLALCSLSMRYVMSSRIQLSPAGPETGGLLNDSMELEEIEELRTRFIAAYESGDVEAASDLYSPDYRGAREGAATRTLAGMKDFLALTFEKYSARRLAIRAEEVLVNGAWALERGTFDLILTPRIGGADVVIRRRYLEILSREPDGSWKILRDLDSEPAVVEFG